MGKLKKIYDFVKWPVIYIGAFSSATGAGGALGGSGVSLENRVELFGSGFVDALPITVAINCFYPSAINLIKKTKHSKIYSNLLCTGISAGFYIALRLQGADNPETAMVLPTIMAFGLTNLQNRTNNTKPQ